MKLVDTSSWIHQMREKGDAVVRARVEALLRAGEAVWCDLVRLEIWAGVGNERERRALREYEAAVPTLPIDAGVWQAARDLASRARRAGKTVPALRHPDLRLRPSAWRGDRTSLSEANGISP